MTLVTTSPPNGMTVHIQDANSDVGMPTGSTIAASVTTAGVACAVTRVSPTPFPNKVYGTDFNILLNGDASCVAGVKIDVTVTSPGGIVTTTRFAL